MTSDATSPERRGPDHLFVWIFLPDATDPVVAGRIDRVEARPRPVYEFSYGRSYLGRQGAIPISLDELPLRRGPIDPAPLQIAGALRDAAPDAWGRRVIVNRLTGASSHADGSIDLDELVYLIESGSDRIGALDFQRSATDYLPRNPEGASLDALLRAAELVEMGVPLTPELDRAIRHGTSIGGARPKASVTATDAKYIAKFSASNDTYNVVRAEAAAMRLARQAGIDAAEVRLERTLGRDVLLVRRFDRVAADADGVNLGGPWSRRLMASALTILGLEEMQARYAGYDLLASEVRRLCRNPVRDLQELFRRLVFNIAIGNTDDHARNTALFFDGSVYDLTPAYDISPLLRVGGEASQAMAIEGDRREARLALAIASAHNYRLTEAEARSIVREVVRTVAQGWEAAADWAGLSVVDRRALRRAAVLHDSIFVGGEDLRPHH